MEDLMTGIFKIHIEMDLEYIHLKIQENLQVNLKMDIIMVKENMNLKNKYLKVNGLKDNFNFDFLFYYYKFNIL